jgi:hypothetical protein
VDHCITFETCYSCYLKATREFFIGIIARNVNAGMANDALLKILDFIAPRKASEIIRSDSFEVLHPFSTPLTLLGEVSAPGNADHWRDSPCQDHNAAQTG